MTTLVALGLAAGSVIGIYSAIPSGGANVWSRIVGLVAPVFMAVGVQAP